MIHTGPFIGCLLFAFRVVVHTLGVSVVHVESIL